jgi:hypothetical protein
MVCEILIAADDNVLIRERMDLYDIGNYFASYITSNALQNSLLRYAAAAIAAKQLGRTHVLGSKTKEKRARTELHPDGEKVDWPYTATKYYAKAIASLRMAIIPDERRVRIPSGLSNSREESEYHATLGTSKRPRNCCSFFSRTRTDRLLAATSILSVYEFLDGSDEEWSR